MQELTVSKQTQTCGVFVFGPDGKILICHVTNADKNTWSIPKGRPDNGETTSETAMRELKEETSLVVDAAKLFAMGNAFYKSGRELVAFGYRLQRPVDTKILFCESLVVGDKKSFPEVDEYKFVQPAEALKLIHATQQKVLIKYLATNV